MVLGQFHIYEYAVNQVDYQTAAPTESRTPNLHRATIAQQECGWKGGDRGGLTEWGQYAKEERKKETK